MAITTYTELLDALQGWLWDRADVVARLPDFVAFCEADLNARLRHRRMVKRVTATFSDGRYPLPADWLEAEAVRLVGGASLKPASQENLVEVERARSASTTPAFFDLIGDEIEIVPRPTSSSTSEVELLYYGALPALATNSTNWLLQARPDVYLYGSLVHSAPYMSEDERLQTWVAAYDRLVASMNDESLRARRSGGPLQRRLRTFG